MITPQDFFSAQDKPLKKTLVVLLALTAFSTPFKDKFLVSPFIVLSAIVWVLNNPFKRLFTKTQNLFALLGILIFFLIHVVALLYSNNLKDSFSNIEVKLSFLIFPLLFYSESFTEKQFKLLLQSFVIGNFVCYLFCLSRAFWFLVTAHENWFFYTDLAWFQHPSYLAMYATFCCLVSLHFKLFSNKLVWSYIAFATLIIILLSSKAGIIIHFSLLSFYFLKPLFKQKNYKKISLYGIIAILTFVLGLFLFPETKNHFSKFVREIKFEKPKLATKESTTLRIFIWKESMRIIKQNPTIGVAPGDVNDELVKHYKEDGLVSGYEYQRNAHNQYLQTTLGLGLVGLTSLLSLFLIPLLKNKTEIVSLFLALTFLHFIPESMLQTMAGTIFFGFFYCLICFRPNQLFCDSINKS